MTIFNPDNSVHIFKIIPRYYSQVDLLSVQDLQVYNEDTTKTDVFAGVTITSIKNGYVSYQITKSVKEGESYQLKITQNGVIQFRGKIFCTSKQTQNYSINE